jgi:hypothetical protein
VPWFMVRAGVRLASVGTLSLSLSLRLGQSRAFSDYSSSPGYTYYGSTYYGHTFSDYSSSPG